MQREDPVHAAEVLKVYRTEVLARQFFIGPKETRKLKILFGDFLTKQEFFANVVRPPRGR